MHLSPGLPQVRVFVLSKQGPPEKAPRVLLPDHICCLQKKDSTVTELLSITFNAFHFTQAHFIDAYHKKLVGIDRGADFENFLGGLERQLSLDICTHMCGCICIYIHYLINN